MTLEQRLAEARIIARHFAPALPPKKKRRLRSCVLCGFPTRNTFCVAHEWAYGSEEQ